MESGSSSRGSGAKDAFDEYLRRTQAGEALDFERFCDERPRLAAELRELHATQRELEALQELLASGSVTLSERLGQLLRDASRADGAPSGELSGRIANLRANAARYRVLDELAHGGMSSILRVWDEDLQRALAMKVMPEGAREGSSASRPTESQKLARFLDEAQITGRLDHPGIVPVHEVGLGSDGRLYFTMRLVQGRDLRQIFELVARGEEGWSTTRTLGVLLKVCEAMAYAHSKGIVHRDLKPSNVMVGDFGEVYVMDWGLARSFASRDGRDARAEGGGSANDDDVPWRTRDGDVIGTPAYMPPEQARGEVASVGPWSDVYSLGAMLYQLLSGEIPYARKGSKVSTRAVLEALADHPPVPLSQLAPRTPAELVSICEKAMARELAQRYRDMSELADDLRAYLEQRVVKAHAVGAAAELRKWIERNVGLALASAAALAILVAGLVASSVLYVRAESNAVEARASSERAESNLQLALANEAKAKEEASKAAARARELQQVSEFQSAMLEQIDPEPLGRVLRAELDRSLARNDFERGSGSSGEMHAEREELLRGLELTEPARVLLQRAIVTPAAAAIGARFREQPVVEAALRHTLAQTCERLGLGEQAETQVERAFELRRATLGADHADTLASEHLLAVLLADRGCYDGAEELLEEALAQLERTLGPDHPSSLAVLQSLGRLDSERGRLAPAKETLRDVVLRARTSLGEEDPRTLAALGDLGCALLDASELEESEQVLREAADGSRRVLGDDDAATILARNNLARVLHERGKLEEAAELYREVLRTSRRVFGSDHPTTLTALTNQAGIHHDLGQLEQAESLLTELVELDRRLRGPDHVNTIRALADLGGIKKGRGRFDEAEPLLREAVTRARAALEPDHPAVFEVLNTLGLLLCERNRLDEAEELLDEALAGRRRVLGPDHALTLQSLNNLGMLYQSRRQYERAAALYREASERYLATLGPDHPKSMSALQNLATALASQGRTEDATAILRDVLARRRGVLGAEHPETLISISNLASILDDAKCTVEAEALYREALAVRRRTLGDQHPDTLTSLNNLGYLLARRGQLAESERLLREALAGRRCALGDEHPRTLGTMHNLARLLKATQRFAEAESLFLEVERALSASRVSGSLDHPRSVQSLIELYRAWDAAEPGQGHAERAAEWSGRLASPTR